MQEASLGPSRARPRSQDSTRTCPVGGRAWGERGRVLVLAFTCGVDVHVGVLI